TTILNLHVAEFSSHRLVETLRKQPFVPGCYCQCVNRRVVTDQAFVVCAVSIKHPRLRAFSESPMNGKRDRSCSIGYGIRTLGPFGLDEISESPFLKGQLWVRDKSRILTRKLEGAPHRSLGLSERCRG